jgi:hypothetical protein
LLWTFGGSCGVRHLELDGECYDLLDIIKINTENAPTEEGAGLETCDGECRMIELDGVVLRITTCEDETWLGDGHFESSVVLFTL